MLEESAAGIEERVLKLKLYFIPVDICEIETSVKNINA